MTYLPCIYSVRGRKEGRQVVIELQSNPSLSLHISRVQEGSIVISNLIVSYVQEVLSNFIQQVTKQKCVHFDTAPYYRKMDKTSWTYYNCLRDCNCGIFPFKNVVLFSLSYDSMFLTLKFGWMSVFFYMSDLLFLYLFVCLILFMVACLSVYI